MFHSVDGKIVQVGGAFPERKVNSLTFQTRDSAFPVNSISSGSRITFGTNVPQSMTVNYGDGTVQVIQSQGGEIGVANGSFEGRQGHLNQHIFTDTENNGNLRNIVFEFEFLNKLTSFVSFYAKLYGAFPSELEFATNISNINLNRTFELESFPDNLSGLQTLTNLNLIGAFNNENKPIFIPDQLFSTPLEGFIANGSFDFQDNISSNLFKINQVSSTLTNLQLANCGVAQIPPEFANLQEIFLLEISGDNTQYIEVLPKLEILRYAPFQEYNNFVDFSMIDLVRQLRYDYRGSGLNDFSVIELQWANLKRLQTIQSYQYLIDDSQNNIDYDTNNDRFIDAFYNLCVNNAFLDSNSTEAQNTDTPNQFKNISWGHGSTTQTGEIQAPAGFVQGVDNGAPANQGEKIYVLVNNYGHNITTSGNFN